jgi:hypothetical protein
METTWAKPDQTPGVQNSDVKTNKFLSVKTLVGFEIFVDFVRFAEQLFVGLISLRRFYRQKNVRQNEQNQQKFQSQLTFSQTKICWF